MSASRLIFMGSPDFAVPALAGLIAADYEIAAVYSQPPRRAGRGQQRHATPAQRLAQQHGLAVATPPHFKKPADRRQFGELGADLAVVVAYGLILPEDVLAATKYGAVNIHASLLPRWRGAAPIQRALMAGDEETGVCLMQMSAGLDTGPVYARSACAIGAQATAGSLHDDLAKMGAALLLEKLPAILAGELKAEPQRGQASYATKVDKIETRIDWELPAAMVDRQIRGLSPFPGAWFDTNVGRIKVLMSSLQPAAAGSPGTVLDDELTVACGHGAVRLERLQRAGREAMERTDFLRGHAIPPGTEL